MSTYDEQDDSAMNEILGTLNIPTPDPDVRRASITLAREEFDALQVQAETKKDAPPQGFMGWLRHIIGNQTDDGRASMYFNQRFIYSGITAAAIGAVAVGLSLQYLPQFGTSGLEPNGVSAPEEQFSEVTFSGLPSEPGKEKRLSDVMKEELYDTDSLHSEYDAGRLAQSDVPLAAPPVSPNAAVTSSAGVALLAKRGKPELSAAVGHAGEVVAHPDFQDEGRDRFEAFEQNPVKLVSEEPVSTFSADVDTASYSFVRRMLNAGVLPQVDAVRAEEMLNYFDYDYTLPDSRQRPFQPTVSISDSPWADGRKLMHIGIKGYELSPGQAPRSNLVFLLDVSGSMNSPDKLPLVKQSMELLLSTLDPDDTVAVAVYAGAAGTVLEPTPVREKQKILDALRQLAAGGSTAGAQGIRLAYELAEANFDDKAVNRVILATDGDFNVGITDQRELQGFVERKRKEGIYLSVLGFGRGNYQDAMMQTLAQNGNGVAAYIDTLGEAQKVLVDEATSALFPIASDVKFQVEFNPSAVAEYRLIGYETRHLNREDFNNDAVDAGDIGAGHTVTAIYEFTPLGSGARQIDEKRYAVESVAAAGGDEYAFLKIRYKLPGATTSSLITRPVTGQDTLDQKGAVTSREAGFATAVAGFAQVLKGGKYTADYSYDDVISLALENRGQDAYGYRTEFIQLVRKAKTASALQSR